MRSHRHMVAGAHERPVTRSSGFRCSTRATASECPKSRAVGEGSNVRYTWLRVDGIPTDSIAPALVVISTNPHETTLNRTRALIRSKDWSGGPGVAGSSPVSPTDARLEFATRGCAVCSGACAPARLGALTRNNRFSCKRHRSPRLRPDAAAHGKRLWQSSAYMALTVLTAIDGDRPCRRPADTSHRRPPRAPCVGVVAASGLVVSNAIAPNEAVCLGAKAYEPEYQTSAKYSCCHTLSGGRSAKDTHSAHQAEDASWQRDIPERNVGKGRAAHRGDCVRTGHMVAMTVEAREIVGDKKIRSQVFDEHSEVCGELVNVL